MVGAGWCLLVRGGKVCCGVLCCGARSRGVVRGCVRLCWALLESACGSVLGGAGWYGEWLMVHAGVGLCGSASGCAWWSWVD